MSRTAQDSELFALLTAPRGWIVKNPLPVHRCDTLSEALSFAKQSIARKRKSPFILARDESILITPPQIVRLIENLGF
jgi:hypothetical protein